MSDSKLKKIRIDVTVDQPIKYDPYWGKKIERRIQRALRRAARITIDKNPGSSHSEAVSLMGHAYARILKRAELLGWIA